MLHSNYNIHPSRAESNFHHGNRHGYGGGGGGGGGNFQPRRDHHASHRPSHGGDSRGDRYRHHPPSRQQQQQPLPRMDEHVARIMSGTPLSQPLPPPPPPPPQSNPVAENFDRQADNGAQVKTQVQEFGRKGRMAILRWLVDNMTGFSPDSADATRPIELIFDIGCGRGQATPAFFRILSHLFRGKNPAVYVGADVAKAAVKEAVTRAAEMSRTECSFYAADMTKQNAVAGVLQRCVKAKSRKAGLYTCFYALHYLMDNIDCVFESMAKKAADGAVFVASHFDWPSILDLIKSKRRLVEDADDDDETPEDVVLLDSSEGKLSISYSDIQDVLKVSEAEFDQEYEERAGTDPIRIKHAVGVEQFPHEFIVHPRTLDRAAAKHGFEPYNGAGFSHGRCKLLTLLQRYYAKDMTALGRDADAILSLYIVTMYVYKGSSNSASTAESSSSSSATQSSSSSSYAALSSSSSVTLPSSSPSSTQSNAHTSSLYDRRRAARQAESSITSPAPIKEVSSTLNMLAGMLAIQTGPAVATTDDAEEYSPSKEPSFDPKTEASSPKPGGTDAASHESPVHAAPDVDEASDADDADNVLQRLEDMRKKTKRKQHAGDTPPPRTLRPRRGC